MRARWRITRPARATATPAASICRESRPRRWCFGESDVDNPSLLKLNGGVQGIGLRLQDQQGQALELNQRSRPYILQPGSNTLWFSASVESTQRAVMAAGFAAVAHIQVIYL